MDLTLGRSDSTDHHQLVAYLSNYITKVGTIFHKSITYHEQATSTVKRDISRQGFLLPKNNVLPKFDDKKDFGGRGSGSDCVNVIKHKARGPAGRPAALEPEVFKPEVSRSRPELLHSHLGHYPRNGFDCRISQRQQQQQKSVGIKLFCIFWRQRTKISARFSELPESTLSKSYQKIQTVIKSAIFVP